MVACFARAEMTDNLDLLPQIANDLKNSNFQVINTDIESMQDLKGRGWRMVAFDLRAPNGQIIEYQVRVKEMDVANDLTHPIFKHWREKPIESLTLNEQKLRLRDLSKARDVHIKAWNDYLSRTGQTLEQVMNVCKKGKAMMIDKGE